MLLHVLLLVVLVASGSVCVCVRGGRRIRSDANAIAGAETDAAARGTRGVVAARLLRPAGKCMYICMGKLSLSNDDGSTMNSKIFRGYGTGEQRTSYYVDPSKHKKHFYRSRLISLYPSSIIIYFFTSKMCVLGHAITGGASSWF